MALDDDGTVWIDWVNDTSQQGPGQPMSVGQVDALQDENFATTYQQFANAQTVYVMIFPELREWDGWFTHDSYGKGTLWRSGDTTNGIGGTWVNETAWSNGTSTIPGYREQIDSFAASSIRALRYRPAFTGPGFNMLTNHVYGEISPGETPDRLIYIDELTGLEFVLPIDYAEIPRGSSADLEWRIKNNSSTLTATTIQYTAEALFLGSAAWYTFTLPAGSTYAATQQIASLAATTTTGLIKIRRVTPAAEDVGLHAGRTYLNVASWA
jgi:hypothetical protein